MRILVLEQRYTRPDEAGIGRFSFFSREWAKKGHRIDVIAGMINYITGKKPDKYKGKVFVKEEQGDRVTIHRVFESSLAYRSFLGRLLSYFTFLGSAFINGLFVSAPDVIIASSPPIFIGFLGWILSILRRAKFVFEVRDLWPDVAVETGFLKNKILIKMSLWLERFLYRQSDALVVNSPGLKKYLIEAKKVSEGKLTVVSNPIDFDLFQNFSGSGAAGKLGWEGKFVVLYSGSMSAVYNFDLILEAAKRMKDSPVIFVLLGDGRQKPALMEKVKKEKVDNVRFLEPVGKKELAGFIKAADVCVASLKAEIRLLNHVYATKIFDYMACGRPIVLAMGGVSAELVCKDAKCGLCSKPGDEEGFLNALIEMRDNPEKAEEMGKQGLKYLRKYFDAKGLANDYLSAIISRTSNRTKGRG